MPTLTADPVAESFAAHGYYIARGLLTPQEVAEIRDTFMAVATDGPVAGLSEVLKHAAPGDPLAHYPRMMHPHCHPQYPTAGVAEKYLLDGRIERHLRACMGAQPIAVQSMFYFKPPGARGQSLHQDNYYLRVRPDTCCAAWMAIDDADAENGGMMVVPGTQDLEVVCPEKADASQSFTTDHVPVPEGLKAVMLELKAGDVLFFNGSLVHGSTPNTSKARFRRSLICHYVPETTTEMSHWYHKALRTFDGTRREFAVAQGGGPCGEAAGPH